MSTRIAVATAIGCFAALPLLGLGPEYVGRAAGVQKPPPPPPPFATFITLPTLNGGCRPNPWDQRCRHGDRRQQSGSPGSLWAVKWTLQDSKWVISKLPAPVPHPGTQSPAASTPLATSSGTDSSGAPRLLARCRRIGFARLQQRCRTGACDQREWPDHCRADRCRADRQSGGGMVPVRVLHRVAAAARSRRIREGPGRHG